MNIPIVSVIVPNYNHSTYLTLRIDSILKQSYVDFELILLDDYSLDSSREILLAYESEPRVSHVVFNDANSGSTFKQWDKGISLARGRYIWIAESDDIADVDFLKVTVEALDQNPNAVIAFTGSQMVDDRGEFMSLDWDKFSRNAVLQTSHNSLDYLSKKMLWGNSVYNASMVVFRRCCFEKINYKYKQFRYCGDWLFWIEVCRQGDVIEINRKLNFFRQHANKVSPKAENDGLYFIEGGEIIQYMFSLLQLSSYQKKVVIGRIQKRLLTAAKTREGLKQKALATHPSLFRSNKWAILFYEFDKIFNLSRLQR